MPPTKIGEVVAAVKAYTTRVGEGPFPTEFDKKMNEIIRSKGHEFGATTGRPRRCGWFDAVLVRYAVIINGATHLAIMKLDVLDELEEIKIATAYKYKGKIYKDYSHDMDVLIACPSLSMKNGRVGGLQPATCVSIINCRPAARRYIERLEELLEVRLNIFRWAPSGMKLLCVKMIHCLTFINACDNLSSKDYFKINIYMEGRLSK